MLPKYIWIVFIFFIDLRYQSTAFNYRRLEDEPPTPLEVPLPGIDEDDYDRDQIFENIKNWDAADNENIWELSGLFEGDILPNSDGVIIKNGLLNETMRWPEGIIPIFIDENDFDEEEIEKIEKAIEEYRNKTCLVFTSYNKTYENYVKFQSSEPGCWSSVGRQSKGQRINLQKPNCLRHGTIVHEILHAVGFYHQQSTSNRDEYVTIHWDNIKPGKEHNFNKYDTDTVTDYDVEYDYNSVMHYSSKAFSKNGNKTITPLKEGVKIGQRKGLSSKDIQKLQIMYEDECNKRKSKE